MMKIIRRTSQFKKDIKRMEKRGKDFTSFKDIVKSLLNGPVIDGKYRDAMPLFFSRERSVSERWAMACHVSLS